MPQPRDHFPFRLEFPQELPISARADEITAAIGAHPVVILAGETGSGKTTQIPKLCLAAGRGRNGRIACTQPRRVAALSVSRRVAEELGVAWGREVGCKVRFSDQTTQSTVIKFLTDGMLLAEAQGDTLLSEYDTIIIDEAHERSLNIDFLLGHLRQLRQRRPDLKIIITSATIDTAAFSAAFEGAPVITVEGRTYPVEVIYAPLDSFGSDADAETADAAEKAEALHYIDGAVEAVRRILSADSPPTSRDSAGQGGGQAGDILVFMPSERDIREVVDLLGGGISRGCEVVPLFGRLTNAEQQHVFSPSQRRKIIVATNIAETSLTIPGIRFVVDTGLARVSRYSPTARTRRLPIEEVAQSSADQRKGRSGRLANGVCIRLYSEEDYLARPRFAQPEIQRANLADVILRLKSSGLGDVERFPFIDRPADKSVRAGYALLEELGAIERNSPASPDSGARPGAGERGGLRPDAAANDGAAADLERRDASARPERSDAPPLSWKLTALGAELARLPVDPSVARMILEARKERALQEVLVIAAGLSIQDPRERPLDKQAQADAAHRRFVHPDSDFLTLLNIWETYHGEFEEMTQAKLRRFCRDHFLSYSRMREWRDVHQQLLDALRERRDFQMSSVFDRADARGEPQKGRSVPPESRPRQEPLHRAGPRPQSGPERPNARTAFGTHAYRAIHRSILSGLLGNIAQRDPESSDFKATHDRRVVLFPGSVLHRRQDKEKKRTGPRPDEDADPGPPPGGKLSASAFAKAQASAEAERSKGPPRWIMAAEVVETSRLFARTCARLDPAWILELGAHLVRTAHSEPFWDAESGRVRVKQRTRLYGLEIDRRSVGYGKIDPERATEIFIREGLVNDTITWPFDFVAHNREVREKLTDALTRARSGGFLNIDEALYRFYSASLAPEVTGPSGVSSVAELVDIVRERRRGEPRFLFVDPSDLHGPEEIKVDPTEFPEALPMENRVIPINYAYRPGQDDDGVTIEAGLADARTLTEAALDWAVPGHLEAKVEHYLRALPKELRRVFVPLAENARKMAEILRSRDRLTGRRETVAEALAAEIHDRHRFAIDASIWSGKEPPDHLRVRVRLRDEKGRILAESRELSELTRSLAEKTRETGKNAADATRHGLSDLLESGLRYELGWLQRDLRALRDLGALTATLAPIESLQEHAFMSIREWIRHPDRVAVIQAQNSNEGAKGREDGGGARSPPAADALAAAVEKAKSDLRGIVPRFVDLLREILTLRLALLVHPQPYEGMEKDLNALLPPDFLRAIPYERLAHVPRYLKAMEVRAKRWRENPAKDRERARQLAPYLAAAARLRPPSGAPSPSLRWLVEEFRVSLFAQELGTAESISATRLDRAIAEAGLASPGSGPAKAAPRPPDSRPPLIAPETGRKSAPLKSLSALDKLLPR